MVSTNTGKDRGGWVQVVVVASFIGIEGALLFKLIWGQVAANPGELIGAICLLAVLLLLTGSIERLKSISFGKEGLKAEVERLQEKTADLEREVANLTLSSMGDEAYFNLRKLASGDFGGYTLEENIGLYTELYHLRNLGFIVLKKVRPPNIRSIRDIPKEGDQLSDYFDVSETGNRYLALRRRSEAVRA